MSVSSVGGPGITLAFAPDVTSGSTFDLDLSQSEVTVSYTGGSFPYVTNSGVLNITSHDMEANTVEGNFAFEASATFGSGEDVSVTDGSFSVSY